MRIYLPQIETATARGWCLPSGLLFGRVPRHPTVPDCGFDALHAPFASHFQSHGKIVVDTEVEHGRSLTRRPFHHATPDAMRISGRFLVTIYTGVGLVSLAVLMVFQTAP